MRGICGRTLDETFDADGFYPTGDLGSLDVDGYLWYQGRLDDMFKVKGATVYPEEVEAALKAHPDVFDAVVVGVPDERWGERVVAVVQPRDGMALSLDVLQAHAQSHVARYKVPRQLHVTDEIPRTPVGKPDYRWARATAMDHADAG